MTRSDKKFLLTSKFSHLWLSSLTCCYIHLLNHEKMCIKRLRRFFLNLQQMTILMRPSCWHQNFGLGGFSAPVQGLCTCIKSWKTVHKIRGQSYFWNMQPVIKVMTFLLASKKLSPRFVSSCPGALYTMQSGDLAHLGMNLVFLRWRKCCGVPIYSLKRWRTCLAHNSINNLGKYSGI